MWIKNAFKCKSRLKKGVQNGLELKHKFDTQKRQSTLLECQLAQMWAPARGHLDWDKTHPFLFFRDKDASQFIFWSFS